MNLSRSRPSDDAIVLAAMSMGRQWNYADEIRGRLVAFGFAVSAQQVAAWLRRLCREDSPMVEAREQWGSRQYAVTRFGRCQIGNHFEGIQTYEQTNA